MTKTEDVTARERESVMWAAIDQEHRRDRLVKRVSVVAWSTTLVVLAVFVVFIGMDVANMVRLANMGAIRPSAVTDAIMPLIAVVGCLSLLIAVLATVGVFFRLRTASLVEIQQRLASLESSILGSE